MEHDSKKYEPGPSDVDDIIEEERLAQAGVKGQMPAGTKSRTVSMNETHALEEKLEFDLKYVEQAVRESREARHSDHEGKYWHYHAQPLWQIVLFGLISVVLIIGQFWFPEEYIAMGEPWGPASTTALAWARLGAFFVGAYCAFMAWPRYRHIHQTEEEAREQAQFREKFHNKFRR